MVQDRTQTSSGRWWSWRALPTGERIACAPHVSPLAGPGDSAWQRETDGLWGFPNLHPDGLEGIDRDYPPRDEAAPASGQS